MKKLIALLGVALVTSLFANPYPDPSAVPHDPAGLYRPHSPVVRLDPARLRDNGVDVVRVLVAWDEASESYKLESAVIERSGTEALVKRTQREDSLGSYKGTLVDKTSGKTLSYTTIGTGMEFRRLARWMTFRFPLPKGDVEFRMTAENPSTAKIEEVVRETIRPAGLSRTEALPGDEVEVRLLKEASQKPALLVNVYAEGYSDERRDRFFQDAQKVSDALESADFPGSARFEMHAVFAPSRTPLGSATDLGTPVPERDSFLGLYFPYWDNFGRWYNVLYPTRESRFRKAVGRVPYDYPMAVVDDGEYWGIGNFMELTAIPARHSSFTYLLTHEFGHFFGLNEEYESGGKTELAFAPEIAEPWSQNITFLHDHAALKWQSLVSSDTPIPTPSSHWHGGGPWGAYKGGYAQTEPLNQSHKPGLSCTMNSGGAFCPVCRAAIEARVKYDLGE